MFKMKRLRATLNSDFYGCAYKIDEVNDEDTVIEIRKKMDEIIDLIDKYEKEKADE